MRVREYSPDARTNVTHAHQERPRAGSRGEDDQRLRRPRRLHEFVQPGAAAPRQKAEAAEHHKRADSPSQWFMPFH